ncbi:EF-P 5-aminopentanol modification-associated protein YfmH [Thermoactinomyces mirandus]|uniref:Insulinase family protein n=1 Tax=Thermoactinomyces mirandus TaxID=2756294 RepID=A0A7W2AST1_9BACL|nr:pitrilysin family protein [Thermoactinomyces mirandus]MBA4603742.1 insulinase family protein [Thermoactinomyces mirandus]
MQKVDFDQVQESLYFEELPNGLSVYVLPKKGFFKTYATFTTKYGSIDNGFQVPGKEKHQVPDGIAHFLEHKMFEQSSGEDVFQEFSRQGASANAFTSFTRTAYLFSCTGQVEQNLTTLLDFVQSPYFTEQNVEKEKGIIGQEIRMYDDNPDWRVYFGLFEAMYQQHPVRIDIAGTTESIAEITRDLLYTCYETFYHPGNMVLFVVGPVDPAQIINLVRENQAGKSFPVQTEIKRFFPDEPEQAGDKLKEIEVSVGISKCMFGFKETKNRVHVTGDELLKQEMATQIVLDALLGSSSELYQSLYDDGLIDDSFGVSYTLDRGFGLSMMGGDTEDPDRLLERIKQELPRLIERGLDPDTFERIRKKKIGANLRYLNSPEWIANQFTGYRFNDADLFNLVPVLESLSLDDVNRRMREHMRWERFAVSIVRPAKD